MKWRPKSIRAALKQSENDSVLYALLDFSLSLILHSHVEGKLDVVTGSEQGWQSSTLPHPALEVPLSDNSDPTFQDRTGPVWSVLNLHLLSRSLFWGFSNVLQYLQIRVFALFGPCGLFKAHSTLSTPPLLYPKQVSGSFGTQLASRNSVGCREKKPLSMYCIGPCMASKIHLWKGMRHPSNMPQASGSCQEQHAGFARLWDSHPGVSQPSLSLHKLPSH